MIKLFSIPLLCIAFSSSFAQYYRYEHTGSRAAIVKREVLTDAKLLSDIIPGHPKKYDYDLDYVSVQISGVCEGKSLSATGSNDKLTEDQKNLITSADLGTDILVKLMIRYKDVAGSKGDDEKTKMIEYALTPGPEIEAEFPGGKEEMTRYLDENVTNKLVDQKSLVRNSSSVIKFTVTEDGQIGDVRVLRPSTDPALDQLLLEAVAKMPKWRAAGNSKGSKVKQEFSISFGGGC